MICLPIRQKTTLKTLQKVAEGQPLADVIEIWFDEIKDLEKFSFEKIRKPILYKWQGNMENLQLLKNAKIKYIDIDLAVSDNVIKEIRKINPKIELIISFHDFEKTPKPPELKKIAERMRKKGADIVKIAATAQNFKDTLTMLEFLNQLPGKKICLCMGKEGLLTRTSGHLLGNYLMYAPLSQKEATASGQIPLKELKKIQSCL